MIIKRSLRNSLSVASIAMAAVCPLLRGGPGGRHARGLEDRLVLADGVTDASGVDGDLEKNFNSRKKSSSCEIPQRYVGPSSDCIH